MENFLAFLTLLVTLAIAYSANQLQRKLAASQRWESLVTAYCHPDFGVSVKAITDFFIEKCDRRLSQIEDKYKTQYGEDYSRDKIKTNDDIKNTIHFHRRNLSYFYWQLWLCISMEEFDKSLLHSYFTAYEMNIMIIVYYMNRAAADKEIFKSVVPNATKKPNQELNNFIPSLYSYFYKEFTPGENEVLQFFD